MNSNERREKILEELINSNSPLKGIKLADQYGVTRQIIVKDIAILRAGGKKIIATPDGYIIEKNNNRVKKVIAVVHDNKELRQELNIIVRYGGIIEDVIVEHPLYGEIKGMLMISNINEIEKFLEKIESNDAKLLSILTNGVHIHTISADNEANMKMILEELREKNFIIE